jgi:hypothetical protein
MRRQLREAINAAAKILGNTPAVCSAAMWAGGVR